MIGKQYKSVLRRNMLCSRCSDRNPAPSVNPLYHLRYFSAAVLVSSSLAIREMVKNHIGAWSKFMSTIYIIRFISPRYRVQNSFTAVSYRLLPRAPITTTTGKSCMASLRTASVPKSSYATISDERMHLDRMAPAPPTAAK